MTRPLNITLVTGAYHPQISSSALQCRAVARTLSGRASFTVLTTATDATLPAVEEIDRVPVHRVIVDPRNPGRLGSLWQLATQFRRAARHADVVHLHGVSRKTALVATLAALWRLPLVITLHTSGQDEPAPIRQLGVGAWWGFRRAQRVVSVSPRLTDCYLAAGLPPERLVQIPNGIDLIRFQPAAAAERQRLKQALGLPADPVILFVGFFSRDKRPDLLFDAWTRTAAATRSTLIYVGASRGTYKEIEAGLVTTLRERAAALGLADRLRVIDPTHQIERYYRAADVYALTSRREAMPVALLEAMACGLPVVATRLTGVTDRIIADGDNGRLFDLDDVETLAALLETLPADTAAAAMGRAARQTIVDHFGLESMAERWLGVYQQVAA